METAGGTAMNTFNRVMLGIGIALGVTCIVGLVVRIVTWAPFEEGVDFQTNLPPGVGPAQLKQGYSIETDLLEGENELTKESLDALFDDTPVDGEIDEPKPAKEVSESPIPLAEAMDADEVDRFATPPGREKSTQADPAFVRYLQGLHRSGLDIVVVFDSTGSMGGVILQLTRGVRDFAEVVTYGVPNARLGFVTYRDKRTYDLEDWEYTVKSIVLKELDKEGVHRLEHFLLETGAFGGGDIPEAVHEGLVTAISKAGWRENARKVIIVVGDAPPHPEDDGLAKTCDLCRRWHQETGGVVNCIDTMGDSKILDEFRKMASAGGGESSGLNDEKELIRQLVLLTFAPEWRGEMEKLRLRLLAEP